MTESEREHWPAFTSQIPQTLSLWKFPGLIHRRKHQIDCWVDQTPGSGGDRNAAGSSGRRREPSEPWPSPVEVWPWQRSSLGLLVGCEGFWWCRMIPLCVDIYILGIKLRQNDRRVYIMDHWQVETCFRFFRAAYSLAVWELGLVRWLGSGP